MSAAVASAARIQTTVAGSYPLTAWLAALPSAVHQRDAVLVVLKTPELAGIDVVTDGVATLWPRLQEACFELWRRKFARLRPSAEVIAEISGFEGRAG